MLKLQRAKTNQDLCANGCVCVHYVHVVVVVVVVVVGGSVCRTGVVVSVGCGGVGVVQ